ncbi:MAG: BamA/TamA family outer membrane protein [candidate division Zixibacteria bacterium]
MMIIAITIAAILSVSPLRIDPAGIDIAGNTQYSDKEIRRLISPDFPEDLVLTVVKGAFHDLGYFSVSVKLDDDNDGRRVLRIDEGAPTSIEYIHIDIYPDSLNNFDRIIDIRGKIASKEVLDQFAIDIISDLAENGMPFARAEWREFSFNDPNKLEATIKIIPGPVCIVKRLLFDRISRTRPETIAKTISLKTGDRYSETVAEDSERLIDRMPYLEIVSSFEIAIAGRDDSCEIVYHIKELPSTRFDGAVGYVGSSEKPEFIGRIDLDFGDILGTGRAFGVKWNKKDRYSGELRMNYKEPFLFGSGFDTRLEAFQIDRDTLYIETGGDISVGYRFGRDLTVDIAFGLRMVEPETDAGISSSTGRSLRVGFDYDKTDYPDNPESGYRLDTEVDYKYRSNRKIIAGDDPPSKITAIGFGGAQYYKPFNNLVLAIGMKGWGIVDIDGSAPVDELKFIGGFENLRGYAEQRFPAFRYGIATAEIRLLTGKNSRFYLFGDFGAIANSQARVDKYEFQPGYGLGILSPTTLGLFKMEIGWGKTGFPSDAVINFGIAGRF